MTWICPERANFSDFEFDFASFKRPIHSNGYLQRYKSISINTYHFTHVSYIIDYTWLCHS